MLSIDGFQSPSFLRSGEHRSLFVVQKPHSMFASFMCGVQMLEEHGSMFVVLEESCSLYVYPLGRHQLEPFGWMLSPFELRLERML